MLEKNRRVFIINNLPLTLIKHLLKAWVKPKLGGRFAGCSLRCAAPFAITIPAQKFHAAPISKSRSNVECAGESGAATRALERASPPLQTKMFPPARATAVFPKLELVCGKPEKATMDCTDSRKIASPLFPSVKSV